MTPKPLVPSGMKRYERLWTDWDRSIQSGKSAEEVIEELSDETILELLAGASAERRFERNLLLTTAQNRMVSQKRAILRSEETTAAAVAEAEASMKRAAEATQDVRDHLERLGESESARRAEEEADAAVEAATRAADAVRSHREEVRSELLSRCRQPEMIEEGGA